jgi:hypothetical protein
MPNKLSSSAMRAVMAPGWRPTSQSARRGAPIGRPDLVTVPRYRELPEVTARDVRTQGGVRPL